MSLRTPLPVLAAGLLILSGACRTAGEHRDDADREVYEIVKARRAELGAGDSFSIDPPENSLRARILAGEFGDEGPPPLDLLACLEVAAENNRGYQDRRESLYLSALDLTLERWDFSYQETGSFEGFLSGDGHEAQDTGILSAFGISKLLGTGMRMVGNASVNLARDVSHGDAWGAVSNLSLNITQPLLRGFGRDIVMEPLTQSERNVFYAARTYERFRSTFAYDVASRYFRLLESYDRLDNEIANKVRTGKLKERNEEFAVAGRMSDIDVDEAGQNVLSAETRVLEAQRSLDASLDDFKLFLGLPIDTSLSLDLESDPALVSEEILGRTVPESDAVAVALAHRLDHLTVLDREEDAERRLRIAADSLRAGLDVSVSAGATSEENAILDYRQDQMSWRVGLEFDLPWDQLPERNSYRSSLINYEAAKRSSEESADTIEAELRNDLRSLAASKATLGIEEGAVGLAARRVESTELKLEAGRANTRTVLDAQESLLQSQNQLARARTDYALAGLALYLDMELLQVDENGFRVDLAPLENASSGVKP